MNKNERLNQIESEIQDELLKEMPEMKKIEKLKYEYECLENEIKKENTEQLLAELTKERVLTAKKIDELKSAYQGRLITETNNGKEKIEQRKQRGK